MPGRTVKGALSLTLAASCVSSGAPCRSPLLIPIKPVVFIAMAGALHPFYTPVSSRKHDSNVLVKPPTPPPPPPHHDACAGVSCTLLPRSLIDSSEFLSLLVRLILLKCCVNFSPHRLCFMPLLNRPPPHPTPLLFCCRLERAPHCVIFAPFDRD